MKTIKRILRAAFAFGATLLLAPIAALALPFYVAYVIATEGDV